MLILLATVALPGREALAQTYRLTSTAFGSAGGAPTSTSPYRLGMTAGQSVTGVGTGPASPLYAESAGFWLWGLLPVLDVPAPGPGERSVQFALSPGSPNPFTVETTLRYAIPSSSGPTAVGLRVYDLSGRLVRTLDYGTRDPGRHSVEWNGRDEAGHPLRNGLYFCRLEAGGFSANRRLILIR